MLCWIHVYEFSNDFITTNSRLWILVSSVDSQIWILKYDFRVFLMVMNSNMNSMYGSFINHKLHSNAKIHAYIYIWRNPTNPYEFWRDQGSRWAWKGSYRLSYFVRSFAELWKWSWAKKVHRANSFISLKFKTIIRACGKELFFITSCNPKLQQVKPTP